MQIVKLEEVAEVIAGQSPPSETYNENSNGLPFYQGKADFGEESPKARVWCTKPIKISQANDILISVRAPVGSVNLNKEDSGIGRGLSAIRSKKIYFKYLYYYLKKEEKNISKLGVGSTFLSITQNDIKKITIPLLSYSDQIRTANLLEKIDILIAEFKTNINLLDELIRSTFYQMFGDPVGQKSNLFKLIDITTKIGSGSTPKGGNENYKDIGISLIRSLNVYNNEFSYNQLAFIDDEQAYNLRNVIVQENDILLNITGASVARCCIVPSNVLPARVNQHVAILRFNTELINPFYANYLLTSESFQKFLKRVSLTKSTTREALTKDTLEQLEIYKPTIEIQNEFASIAQKIEAIKTQQERQLLAIQELYSSINQKIFDGGIDLSRILFDETLLPEDLSNIQKSKKDKSESVFDKFVSISEMIGKNFSELDTLKNAKEKFDDIFKKWDVARANLDLLLAIPNNIQQQVLRIEKIRENLNYLSIIKTNKKEAKLNWEIINFDSIAEFVKLRFGKHYFNSEMLLRYLTDDLGINVFYFSSAEQKKNPQYENADDYLTFISGALTNQNAFLSLEQVFYNAETGNIPNISFTEKDSETLAEKSPKDQSGIYFHIKYEATTS